MALFKHRPKISLMVPRALVPGQEFHATIVIEARRPVPVEWIDVTLDGLETSRIGGGQYQQRQKHHIARLHARLTEARELPVGATEYRCSFTLPRDAPPSYQGMGATVAYKMNVRASIPWWPDARPAFWISVSPPAQAAAPGKPMLYSTEPEGPRGRRAHMEISLADSAFMPGDALDGAVALHNVAFNKYHGLRVQLIGRETVEVGSQRSQNMPHRYQFVIPFSDPEEGRSIPFSLRVPTGIPASCRSRLWSFDWFLRFRAMLRWSRDMVVEVPLTMAPRAHSDSAINRQYRAPPSVGEDRLQMVWRRVAETTGMDFDGQALLREQGGVKLSVRRQHQGSDGLFVVAALSYPAMHLDLRVQPATGLRRFGGLSLEVPLWDRKFHLSGRHLQQLRALLCGAPVGARPLVEQVLEATSVEMNDEELRVLWRDAGQGETALRRVAVHALAVAKQLDWARQRIPAPAVMSEVEGPWRALAEKLHGPLETARMAIKGNFQGIPCEVNTAWDAGGEPLHTRLVLRPPLGISSSNRLDLQVDGSELREQAGSVAELPGEARELLPTLVDGAHSLLLSDEAISVFLDAPLLEPLLAHERLLLMAQLVAAVQPNQGPYR